MRGHRPRTIDTANSADFCRGLLDPLDALIAASAINGDLTLATKNRKHFKAIDELKLEVVKY